MSISFQCKSCGKKLKAPDSAAGTTSTCPGCGKKVTCPEAFEDAEVVEMGPPPNEAPGFNPFADLDDDTPYTMTKAPSEELAPESRHPCPMCGEMILSTAAKCRFCGEVFDPSIKKAKPKKSGGKKGELRKIATLHKYLVMSILVFLLSYVGLIVTFVIMRPTEAGPPNIQGPGLVILVVLWLVVFIASLTAWVLSVMLASKLWGTGGAVLVLLLQFLPCVNLLTLLKVSSKATNLLRDKGHTVGFLGPDLSEFR
jgi:predicted RNA-binding Zn-ribbon protein involved in translation (DUF1610 family)